MLKSKIPEKLINFNIFVEGDTIAGVADITLPDIEAMSETIQGAGVAGEIDVPTIGHFGSMAVGLSFRTVTDDAILLTTPDAKLIEARSALQNYNTATAAREVSKLAIVAKVVPKKLGLGKMAAASAMDASGEYEVIYLKVSYEDRELLEIDKLNYIYKVNGKDYLAEVRDALGM